jgi:hypothetical protein
MVLVLLLCLLLQTASWLCNGLFMANVDATQHKLLFWYWVYYKKCALAPCPFSHQWLSPMVICLYCFYFQVNRPILLICDQQWLCLATQKEEWNTVWWSKIRCDWITKERSIQRSGTDLIKTTMANQCVNYLIYDDSLV